MLFLGSSKSKRMKILLRTKEMSVKDSEVEVEEEEEARDEMILVDRNS